MIRSMSYHELMVDFIEHNCLQDTYEGGVAEYPSTSKVTLGATARRMSDGTYTVFLIKGLAGDPVVRFYKPIHQRLNKKMAEILSTYAARLHEIKEDFADPSLG
ncbi:MAG: hypothetical protein MRY78_14775 [Saprospiraceae bacterium]|nr:hypothetical protein [Saprospiraceae bacterium]